MVYVAQFSDFKNYIQMNNFVPEYARDFKKEYLYIKGLNYEFKYFEENIDNLNKGLFKSDKTKEIKKIIKDFIKGQVEGEFKNINGLVFDEKDVENLIKIRKIFDFWKLRYDACNDVSDSDGYVNEVVYHGFGDLYYLFEFFYNKLNIEYEDSDEYESDREEFDISFSESDMEKSFFS